VAKGYNYYRLTASNGASFYVRSFLIARVPTSYDPHTSTAPVSIASQHTSTALPSTSSTNPASTTQFVDNVVAAPGNHYLKQEIFPIE